MVLSNRLIGLLLAMLLVRNVVVEGIVLRDVPEFVLCYLPEQIYFFPLSLSYSNLLSQYKTFPLAPLLTGFVRVMVDVGYLVVVLILVLAVGLPGIAVLHLLGRKVVGSVVGVALHSCLCDLYLWMFRGGFASYANTKYMQVQVEMAQLHQKQQ